MPSCLSISHLSLQRSRRPVLQEVSCTITGGALVGILGPNGAGKTSLLEAILGWLPPVAGSITIDGVTAHTASGRMSYLAQRHQLDSSFPLLVADVVAMGRYQQLGFARRFRAEDHARVAAAIAELGLQDLATRHIAQLSGGQLQRTLLARALCTGADIFLLDEPLAGLDPVAGRDLLLRLASWQRHGRLVLMVLHDLAAAREFCSHVLLINRRLVAWGAPAEAMTREHLAATFGPHVAHDGLGVASVAAGDMVPHG